MQSRLLCLVELRGFQSQIRYGSGCFSKMLPHLGHLSGSFQASTRCIGETGQRTLYSTHLNRFTPEKSSRFKTDGNGGAASGARPLLNKFELRNPEPLP